VKSPDELKAARARAKAEALKALGIRTDKPVVVWARRLTRYKRPHFIAQLIEDLDTDLFFLLGGRAHPNDDYGVRMMAEFRRLASSRPNVAYIPDLYVEKARYIVWASDIFTFTPFSGWEASGTSFMKAGINGIPPVASRDGAVEEGSRTATTAGSSARTGGSCSRWTRPSWRGNTTNSSARSRRRSTP